MPDSTSTERRCDEERERISLSPSALFRSLSLWTCSSPPHLCLNLSFYPTLKLHRHTSVFLFQYLLLNLYCSLYSAHVFCSPTATTWVFFYFYSWYLILRYHRRRAGPQVSECNEGYVDSECNLKQEQRWAKTHFMYQDMDVDRVQESPSFHISLLSNDVLKMNLFNWYTSIVALWRLLLICCSFVDYHV